MLHNYAQRMLSVLLQFLSFCVEMVVKYFCTECKPKLRMYNKLLERVICIAPNRGTLAYK